MKLAYTLFALLIISNLAISQNVSVVQNGGVKIVNVYSPAGLNSIVPASGYNNNSKVNGPVNQGDNISSFNWTLKFSAAGRVFHDVSFVNTQVGFIASELGYIYRSTNGGDNWTQVLGLGFPYYWYGVHALSVDTIVIAGFNDQDSIRRGAIRWSFDGGSTWTNDIVLTRPTNGVGWLSRVHFYNQNNGIVFNEWSGACYYTTTGGKTTGAWNFVQVNPDLGWFAGNYDFQPSGTIYGTGIHIAKSTDFGVTWTSGSSADGTFDGGIDFIEPTNQFGWTGGGEISPSVMGWTHETTDGGNTWGPRQMTFTYPIRAVKFFNANTGFAVGGEVNSGVGGIYSTSNGGAAWNLDITTSAEMSSLDYKSVSPDSMDVWCVGSTSAGGYTGKLYKARLQNLVGIRPISSGVPSGFGLYQNYPNPFNPTTNIRYDLKTKEFVTLKIFDVTGKAVATLVSQSQNTGTYEVDFDASHLASGIYFYKLSFDGFSDVKKMALVK